MIYLNPLNAIDFYKADHRRQYPEGTTEIYSNMTARSINYNRVSKDLYEPYIIFFGLQYFIKDFLIDSWNKNFFQQDKSEVIEIYNRRMANALGAGKIDVAHIEALYDLGYLPLKIKSLEEGSKVPINVPFLTIVNTRPEFYWLTNYIESVLSCYLWKMITSATTANAYRQMLEKYAKITGTSEDLVQFQIHDFSLRGMGSLQDAAQSGAAHLTSFVGTDSVPAIDLLEDFYNSNADLEIIGVSVPATEHSVMCMGGQENEFNSYKRLINEIYPDGIVSIVSDTWDLWKVVDEYIRNLKSDILKRNGKVVIRPDSGDPVKIICGDRNAHEGSNEYKGVLNILWEIFGGTITSTGHKMLDEHIGIIYGDSITISRANEILKLMEAQGFASGNIVFGIGSETYQYTTRDNFGFATKTTSGVVQGLRVEVFKNPKTDSGIKKSAKGLLRVEMENNKLVLYDQQTAQQESTGMLQEVFVDGVLLREVSLSDIRKRIRS